MLELRYLGVDAALNNIGWAYLSRVGCKYKLLSSGVIKLPPKLQKLSCLRTKLYAIRKGLDEMMDSIWDDYMTGADPLHIVIETNYTQIYQRGFSPHYHIACGLVAEFFEGWIQQSAHKYARIFEYTPNETRRITGNTRANKEEVQQAAQRLLPDIDWATVTDHNIIDALAAILTHIHKPRLTIKKKSA